MRELNIKGFIAEKGILNKECAIFKLLEYTEEDFEVLEEIKDKMGIPYEYAIGIHILNNNKTYYDMPMIDTNICISVPYSLDFTDPELYADTIEFRKKEHQNQKFVDDYEEAYEEYEMDE